MESIQKEQIKYLTSYKDFRIGDVVSYSYYSYTRKEKITSYAILLGISKDPIDYITYAHLKWLRTMEPNSINFMNKLFHVSLTNWKRVNIQLLKRINNEVEL